MRVLHLVCSDRFAGVERHVALLAGAQQEAGATVAVIGGDEVPMRRDIGRDDVLFRPTGGLLQTIRTRATTSAETRPDPRAWRPPRPP